jgi:hypothetical protein
LFGVVALVGVPFRSLPLNCDSLVPSLSLLAHIFRLSPCFTTLSLPALYSFVSTRPFLLSLAVNWLPSPRVLGDSQSLFRPFPASTFGNTP